MRIGWLITLGVSSVLCGCYDFGKTYDPCLDEPSVGACSGTGGASNGTGASTGNNPGVGGASSDGGTASGGTASGGSGTGGDGSGGLSTGGSSSGGAATGGSGTGGATVALVGRAKLNEACPTTKAVEIYNPGPDPIPLSELTFSATKTGFSYKAECVLSGELAANGYIVFAAAASGCSGVPGTCISSDCIVDFDYSIVKAWFRLGTEEVSLGFFDDEDVKPAISQCWARTAGDGVKLGSSSLGEANP